MSRSRFAKVAPPALAAAALLTAAAPVLAQPAVNDPYERMNRSSYAVTEAFDKAVLGPIARGYKHVPEPGRDGVRNVLANLNEPLNVVNYVLQLRVGKAANSVGRFAVNSTVGLAGLFDQAGKVGLESAPTDFGKTFARYGAGPGPYVYVPLVGPSTVRDSIGATVSIFADPLNIARYRGRLAVGWTRFAVTGIQTRADFDEALTELRRTAVDPYASLRSLYLQNRAAAVGDGQIDVEALPSFDDPSLAPDAPSP